MSKHCLQIITALLCVLLLAGCGAKAQSTRQNPLESPAGAKAERFDPPETARAAVEHPDITVSVRWAEEAEGQEAIRTLAAQGVLEVRRGKGTFVSETVGTIDDFGFDRLRHVRGQLHDLFELRSIFEPRAAALACRRATERERAEILEYGRAVEQCILQGKDRAAADRAFHAAIVRATHNEFLMRLLPLIDQAVSAALIAGEHQEQLTEDTRRDHALLMEFFSKGDDAGTEYAMAIHMRHSMDVMELEQP